MSLNTYFVPEELEVDRYFKKNPFPDWSFPQYYEWKKRLNPFNEKFNKMQKEYNDNLEIIKKSSLVHDDVKSQIQVFKKSSKGKAKDKEIHKIVNNITYKGHASHYKNSTINNIMEVPKDESSRCSIVAENKSAMEREGKRTFEFHEDSNEVATTDSRMNSLYHYLYKLHKHENIDLNTIPTLPTPTTIDQKLYNECIRLLKTYKDLTPVEKSKLHVLLSSYINTVSPVLSFSKYANSIWAKLKQDLQKAYEAGGKKGLRKFVVRERRRIYEDEVQDKEEFNLMIMDVYDLILNNVTFKDWYEEHLHEEDFGCYWKSVFDIIFRGTNVSLIRGEACCLATKYDRQLNEYEYGDVSTGVYGRKIDLIFKGSILDDKRIKKNIELSSVEIKPASVSEDVEAIQLNKNIRVNKSILHNIAAHMGELSDDCYVLGIDIIGLSAFVYSVYQYEDIIAAVKVEEDNLFLPGDFDDLEDLVFGNTLDQLLNFKVKQYIQSIISK
ncbi:uncharacterized protein EV154DRAFT_557700 [Mucor mucedo]|uniref:uncharacterized protein n=1 Tax=Mucor mucedo TaxID=29922 RepID=UPI00221FF88B|nr:uncharacterized protein EV154DRAFT_557700 [Mucor mucedo]KAI7897397.1 hypothetical protein EV154DRAFT_557700 [Mucor mucedo]